MLGGTGPRARPWQWRTLDAPEEGKSPLPTNVRSKGCSWWAKAFLPDPCSNQLLSYSLRIDNLSPACVNGCGMTHALDVAYEPRQLHTVTSRLENSELLVAPQDPPTVPTPQGTRLPAAQVGHPQEGQRVNGA